jgi:glycosyltransferase involved in cell wall biosynthesis
VTNRHERGRARIAIVCPIVARYDAISAAARDTWRVFADDPCYDTTLFTLRNDFADLPARVVSGVGDLLLRPEFITADLTIYHFGIHNELIDGLIVGKARQRQVVRFHNITPPELAPADQRAVIQRSFRQIHLLKDADEIWADSELNAAVLRDYGIDAARIRVIPLIVDDPAPARLSDKAAAPIEILFLGRFVPSKGALDLLEAVEVARGRTRQAFRLRLVGNLEWSDAAYLRRIEEAIAAGALGEIVELHGTVDDVEREALLRAAHILVIPSYHEGFCKPVIEALRSGAVPIGYAAANLPAIMSGLGRLVPPGDRHALGATLAETIDSIGDALARPSSSRLVLDRGPMRIEEFEHAVDAYVNEFAFDRVAPRMRACARALIGMREYSENNQPRNYPPLSKEHIDSAARLFANRNELVESLGIAPGQAVAEVGVALGDFSEFLLRALEPSCFVAIDLFKIHEIAELWGRPTSEIFGNGSHLDYYRRRFARYGDRIRIEEGLSQEMLARYPDDTFALIYIDAGHDYENVRRDAELAALKLKQDGVIVFNDYTMSDLEGTSYGVVPAVNELVAGGGWRVVGFALQPHMFCDIAIRRVTS